MPRNYYIGWTISELEPIRRAIQRTLTTGVATEISIAGVRTVYSAQNSRDLECQLDRMEYALFLADQAEDTPTGDYPNPYATRNRHTIPSFQ